MAPLPTNSTGRLVVSYTANGHEHDVMFRFGGSADNPVEAFYERIEELFTEMTPLMPSDWSIISSVSYPQGSDVSHPDGYIWSPVVGTGTPQVSEGPAFISFVGRGTSGRRARLYFLGASLTPADEKGSGGDYRLYGTENSDVLAAIFAATQLEVVTIAGDAVFWKNYVNLGYNAYWQKNVRG